MFQQICEVLYGSSYHNFHNFFWQTWKHFEITQAQIRNKEGDHYGNISTWFFLPINPQNDTL